MEAVALVNSSDKGKNKEKNNITISYNLSNIYHGPNTVLSLLHLHPQKKSYRLGAFMILNFQIKEIKHREVK